MQEIRYRTIPHGWAFWPSSMKTELVHRTQFRTRREAKAALFEYIEIFYNQKTLRANDDETQAARKFRLEGVGELSRGHAQ